TGFFDGGDRRLRGTCDLDLELARKLAFGEQADPVEEPAEKAGGAQRLASDGSPRGESPGIDRRLDAAQIHHGVAPPEDVVETALGQAAVQRHLAAFIAVEGDAGAGGLTLAATAAGLPLAGAESPAHRH